MRMTGRAMVALVAALAVPAAAEEVPVETTETPEAVVRLHLHPFLTPEELAVLRLVATNADARAVFIPTGAGHAALAVAPREGFVRDGAPVASATAVAGARDAKGAAADALKGCDDKRKRRPACVIVLELAVLPK